MKRETEPRSLARRIGALVLLYAVSTLLGGALFVALMRLALVTLGPGVMFYRGLGALVLVFVSLIALFMSLPAPLLRRLRVDGADALGAAMVATSLLVAAFVLGPVTVDRSVSVFMLTQFDAADRPLTEREARDAFSRVYVNEWAQIDRRLKEQQLSGNLERIPSGWRLTAQGRAFMRTARVMSDLFGGDPRFVGGKV